MTSVLLLDGDRNFREALAIALRLDGCAVVASPGAPEILALLAGDVFDLCLVDLGVKDAESLLASAPARHTRMLVTGQHPELVEAMARRYPPVGALPKPFGTAEVLARLPALQ